MRKNELTERLMNPQPYDYVVAISDDGLERKMRYCDLSPYRKWENITEFGDEIPVFLATFYKDNSNGY